jgi:hypothetical protein
MFDLDPKVVTEWVVTGEKRDRATTFGLGIVTNGPGKDALQNKITEAEDALKRSDGKLAKKLGYKLCRCTFPHKLCFGKKPRKLTCAQILNVEGSEKS